MGNFTPIITPGVRDYSKEKKSEEMVTKKTRFVLTAETKM